VHYDTVAAALSPFGLLARGAFAPDAGDGLPLGTVSVVMVGNAGAAMWEIFAAERRDEQDAMNRWTRRTLDPVAEDLGAQAVYPFDGPPWFPFQRWAQRAEPVFASPIGMLVHPDHGLWHAYRGALAFSEQVEGAPPRESAASPCDTCADKPCLHTCPVGAFDGETYDVPACAAHLRTQAGRDCMEQGCRARRACPVGKAAYGPGQAAFHMAAFLASR